MYQPSTLVVDLTYRCNSPCRYCRWSTRSNSEGKADRSVHDICLDAATLRALGTQRVVFSGGEPLLHPYINAILGYYAGVVEQRVVITNGALLSAGRRCELTAAGATGFAFSLDTVTPERYFAARGWGASHLRRVCSNLEAAAADRSGIELGINAVVTRPTAAWPVIRELLEYARSLELDCVKFQPVFDDGFLAKSAPWLALGRDDAANLSRIAQELGQFDALPTNPPAFWWDLAILARGERLKGARCGLGALTALATPGRLARCYWVPAADMHSTVTPSSESIQQSLAALDVAKPVCEVRSACFCLQSINHAWS